ncbi:MAG: prefoldin subunit beta [Candidatus Micrarchaeota archaeon]|nr:prefoldin subunit beta [Candidatus Micrarchaeota archaeon]
MDIPKEVEHDINEFQTVQNQLQMILVQKQQLKMQLEEIDYALEELKGKSGKVFKSIGSVLVESNSEDVTKELNDRKETMKVRTGVLGKQEEKLRNKLVELKSKIEKAAGEMGAA